MVKYPDIQNELKDQPKTWLVTGVAGFIGSHLAEAYLEIGDEVYIIDDLSTGSRDNIEHLQKEDGFGTRLFVDVDTILNHEKMLELIGICDMVFHLAAAVGVKYILEHPMESINVNVIVLIPLSSKTI